MAQRGVYARRNAGHKAEHARRYAEAVSDEERLAVAVDWLRASLALLQRRRPARGVARSAHRAAAVRLMRDTARELKGLAERIDSGAYDAKGADSP
jgi:hypothetical protein